MRLCVIKIFGLFGLFILLPAVQAQPLPGGKIETVKELVQGYRVEMRSFASPPEVFEGSIHQKFLFHNEKYLGRFEENPRAKGFDYFLWVEEKTGRLLLWSPDFNQRTVLSQTFIGIPEKITWNAKKRELEVKFYETFPAKKFRIDSKKYAVERACEPTSSEAHLTTSKKEKQDLGSQSNCYSHPFKKKS